VVTLTLSELAASTGGQLAFQGDGSREAEAGNFRRGAGVNARTPFPETGIDRISAENAAFSALIGRIAPAGRLSVEPPERET
jgi:hypothetical protein